MKKILLLILATGFYIGLYAQENSTVANDSTAKAKIVFEKLVHDFAIIEIGGDGTCVFKFKNEGTVPLVLSNVKASCGCTTPSWTKDPVLPNTTGEIKVKYDTKRVGNFSKTITVTSNAETPTVVLKITGEVKETN